MATFDDILEYIQHMPNKRIAVLRGKIRVDDVDTGRWIEFYRHRMGVLVKSSHKYKKSIVFRNRRYEDVRDVVI